ncbi:MAG: phosphatidylserine decarboxylase [Pelagibaca sp.]
MRMTDTFIKPMHPEGRTFVTIFAAITVVLFAMEDVLGWVGVGLTVWCSCFFRDPERVTRVSVFMSVLSSHVNRTSLAKKITYRPGKFLNASLDKPEQDNRRNPLVMRRPGDRLLTVTQLVGMVAGRIRSFTQEGAEPNRADRFGRDGFGSRLAICLPEAVKPMALAGQTIVPGETVIADMTA